MRPAPRRGPAPAGLSRTSPRDSDAPRYFLSSRSSATFNCGAPACRRAVRPPRPCGGHRSGRLLTRTQEDAEGRSGFATAQSHDANDPGGRDRAPATPVPFTFPGDDGVPPCSRTTRPGPVSPDPRTKAGLEGTRAPPRTGRLGSGPLCTPMSSVTLCDLPDLPVLRANGHRAPEAPARLGQLVSQQALPVVGFLPLSLGPGDGQQGGPRPCEAPGVATPPSASRGSPARAGTRRVTQPRAACRDLRGDFLAGPEG